ncbi:hypothetical protein LPJ59_000210 [Coemansia sp. RSA 2399]|nr:hypothetical protein LPJ59_000210 [Coemansia sp. RSA 2399]KAJ1908311.1 hypothetical protein LPJ81_000171 [Coemansia sp. IMI 209127]
MWSNRAFSRRTFVIALVLFIAATCYIYPKHIDRLNEKTSPLCADIPIPDHYWTLTDAEMTPFIEIPRLRPVEVGHTVCVRVVLPARLSRNTSSSSAIIYTPLPGTPWDSIMLDMVGNSTGISVPVDLQPAQAMRGRSSSGGGGGNGGVHVYEADVLLRDVDVFVLAGFIEYRDAEWNFEGGLPIVEYEPEPLFTAHSVSVAVVDSTGTSPYSLERHESLPLCRESNPDGRWVSVDDIPFDQTELLPSDNHNRTWLPYTCRMQRYDYRTFAQCLVDKYPVMHVYGDSNTRRYLKLITLLGNWCKQPGMPAWGLCICEDFNERSFDRFNPLDRNVLIDMDPINGGRPPTGQFSMLMAPANKSRIYLRKWDGLTPHNSDLAWSANLDMGVEQAFGHAQVVVFSLTNWDVAFTTRGYFASQIQILLDKIESNYANDTKIIVRTGQYFCCRIDKSPTKRQYSRMRNRSFDRYLIGQFEERFGATRSLSIWDVASLEERRPIEVRKTDPAKCASNHARSELIDIENQVLFNHMCNY